jgi:hypothetical protein
MTMPTEKYRSLRKSVTPELAALPDRQLSEALIRNKIDVEQAEGFFDDLGRFALKAAPAVLPVAGQVLGTVVGGPAGAALGGSLGSLAGGAISNLAGPRPAPSPPPPPPMPMVAPPAAAAPPAAPAPIVPASGGAPAAGQLLQAVTRPETLQALASMAMGILGKQNVNVGSTPVPLTAFSNMLGALAGRAEAEYNTAMSQNVGSVPDYLLDYAGEPKGDPAIAGNRANALYALLNAAGESEAAESGEGAEAEAAEGIGEWESEADAIELVEMAESEAEEA